MQDVITIHASIETMTGQGIEYLTDEEGNLLSIYCDGFQVTEDGDSEGGNNAASVVV